MSCTDRHDMYSGLCIAENPEPNKEITRLENQSGTLSLLVTTVEQLAWALNHLEESFNKEGKRTPTRSACISSEKAASWSCTVCTRDARQSSW